MLSTQWCVCTFLAFFAAFSISTIDAKPHQSSHHKCAQHHKSAQHHKCAQHHKSAQHHNGSQHHKSEHHNGSQHTSARHHKSAHHNGSQHKSAYNHTSANNYRTIYVDPSGGEGFFKTIQAAIDSVPCNNNRWICIRVAKGIYREQVSIPQDKPFIYLKGHGKKTTLVVWDAHDSVLSATFSTQANYTIVKGMSFINSFNYPPDATNNPRAPAVAALVKGDKSAFYKCGFHGLQDTLWDYEGRHYFKDCTIEGAVDFIFGSGQSLYEGCHISVIAGDALAVGFVTAQGREHEYESNGFVFKNCRLDGTGETYLGRAWRNHARVVFYNTYMSDIVVPEGWEPWSASGHENQLTFAENNCQGPGSDRSMRVYWETELDAEQLKQLTSISFIDDEGWIHTLPYDFLKINIYDY